MSTLNPDLLQEGNGIYGWDLINPYLHYCPVKVDK